VENNQKARAKQNKAVSPGDQTSVDRAREGARGRREDKRADEANNLRERSDRALDCGSFTIE
jgi:uncharacterized protein involved in type VI secretion and phage assembly